MTEHEPLIGYFIDEPGPFEPLENLLDFEQEMLRLPQQQPQVRGALEYVRRCIAMRIARDKSS